MIGTVTVKLGASALEQPKLDALKAVILRHPGDSDVLIEFEDLGKTKTVRLSEVRRRPGIIAYGRVARPARRRSLLPGESPASPVQAEASTAPAQPVTKSGFAFQAEASRPRHDSSDKARLRLSKPKPLRPRHGSQRKARLRLSKPKPLRPRTSPDEARLRLQAEASARHEPTGATTAICSWALQRLD